MDEVKKGTVNVEELLSKFSDNDVLAMREEVISLFQESFTPKISWKLLKMHLMWPLKSSQEDQQFEERNSRSGVILLPRRWKA